VQCAGIQHKALSASIDRWVGISTGFLATTMTDLCSNQGDSGEAADGGTATGCSVLRAVCGSVCRSRLPVATNLLSVTGELPERGDNISGKVRSCHPAADPVAISRSVDVSVRLKAGDRRPCAR